MAKKQALGRGLGALLPGSPTDDKPYDWSKRENPSDPGGISLISVALIDPNPYQPRTHFDDTAIEELADSIASLGIVQPLTVRAGKQGRFDLIAGERRLRASKRAGLTEVPAYVREADTEAMLEMALVENVQREQLNPIEVALGYERLMQECGLTQEMVATKVGKSRPAVANFLRLLKLPPEAQAAVRDEALSMGHARALLPVTSAEDQRAFLQKAIAESWSVRQLEEAIRRYLADPAPAGPVAQAATTPPSRAELELRAITDALRTALATQVRVKHTASEGKGRIEIDYYSEEDLQRLIDLLVR